MDLLSDTCTYRNTRSNRDDHQTHDVAVDVEDAARSSDQRHHSEAEQCDPEDGRQEAHQVVLPARRRSVEADEMQGDTRLRTYLRWSLEQSGMLHEKRTTKGNAGMKRIQRRTSMM